LSNKFKHVLYYSPNELLKFSCKITGFTKATLISSVSFCCCCCCIQANTHHFPEKKMAKLLSLLVTKARQINAKLIAFQWNFPRKLPRNQPFFTDRFSAKVAWKIPAKSAIFSTNLSLEIPRNLTFSSRTYQKPCL